MTLSERWGLVTAQSWESGGGMFSHLLLGVSSLSFPPAPSLSFSSFFATLLPSLFFSVLDICFMFIGGTLGTF